MGDLNYCSEIEAELNKNAHKYYMVKHHINSLYSHLSTMSILHWQYYKIITPLIILLSAWVLGSTLTYTQHTRIDE